MDIVGLNPVIDQTMSLLKARAQESKPTPQKQSIQEKAAHLAQEYEGQFISLMLKEMFTSLGNEEDIAGNSSSEESWRELMIDEYGKQISENGGIGIADQIAREMIRMQQAENGIAPTNPIHAQKAYGGLQ